MREKEQLRERDEPVVAVAAQPVVATSADRVLALQRSAGNAAVSRALGSARLARFSTPLQSGVGAGKKATDLAVFLEIIRVEEGKLPEEERLNTKLMITQAAQALLRQRAAGTHI